MQNVDYSKKVKKEIRRPQQAPKMPTYEFKETPIVHKPSSPQNASSILQFLSKKGNQPLPFLYLFVGSVLLFTSGLLIGLKIDHKENTFASQEINTFSNVNSAEPEVKDENSASPENLNPSPAGNDFEENAFGKENIKQSRGQLPSVPKNLQFPPKLNQTNYIIQLGNFSREDAAKFAASLIREKQEFQGRIFRTTTGKLYLGYYYSMKEAKDTLKRVKKYQNGAFADASIKNIQF